MNLNPLRVLLGGICLSVASFGSTVTYTEVLPTDITCPTLTAFSTTGATMVGLSVTAQFADGFSQQLLWAATGANSGGVTQATGAHQWSLNNAGDTFTTDFVLTNGAGSTSNITDIIISGLGGVNASGQGTIFDRTRVPNTSGTANQQTPGSP